MKYGLPYKEVVFNRKALELVVKVISYKHNWTRGEISNGTKSNRSSEIAWLGDRELLAMLLRMVKKINIDSRWNLSITGVEAVQFGKYGEGDFYGWHIDNGVKGSEYPQRKLSITLQLSDASEYEGGDFQIHSSKLSTLPKEKGLVIAFPSYSLHQVTPVTKGSRKSLVVWLCGKPFQ